MYSYPRIKEEWWANVDEYWPQLQSILWRYLPMLNAEKIDEETNKVVISLKPMREVIEEAKHNHNVILARYFSAAWLTTPDSGEIHSIPGWDVFCDLLSEEDVLYPEEKLDA
jgi:hypothetical protein